MKSLKERPKNKKKMQLSFHGQLVETFRKYTNIDPSNSEC